MSTRSDSAPILLTTRDGYDRWSNSYDRDANPLPVIEEPIVDELLGDVNGLAILDVGCGTGRHACRLANAGATVTAIDFSEGMLSQAQAKPGVDAITFRVHDLAQPLPFGNQSFDRVVCGLVVDHIADLIGLFREMLRVCRPSGSAVVTTLHPTMILRGVQARFRENDEGREYRPASESHSITDYVMAAVKAGASIDRLIEKEADESLAVRAERARKYIGWPMLFAMKLNSTSIR